MKDFFIIGEIIKPQGIKGEVKIKPHTDDVRHFLSLKEVYTDGVLQNVVKARVDDKYAYLIFTNCKDRNSAETLRNKLVSVERKNGRELKENNYFIADLIGCGVFTEDGDFLGNIADITKGNRDIITVNRPNGETLLFPFLKDLLVSVDVRNKKMAVDKKRLNEVGVVNK